MARIGPDRSSPYSRRNSRSRVVGWCLAAVLILGCGKPGPKIVAVSGSVTLDGAPLKEGIVSFVSPTGSAASAHLDAQGEFHLSSQYGRGILPGEYRVAICPLPVRDPQDRRRMMGGTRPPEPESPIPERYRRADLSGLTASVQSGTAHAAFELTTP